MNEVLIFFLGLGIFTGLGVMFLEKLSKKLSCKQSQEQTKSIEPEVEYSKYLESIYNTTGIQTMDKEIETAREHSISVIKNHLRINAEKGRKICAVFWDWILYDDNLKQWLKDNNFLYVKGKKNILIYIKNSETEQLSSEDIIDRFNEEQHIENMLRQKHLEDDIKEYWNNR